MRFMPFVSLAQTEWFCDCQVCFGFTIFLQMAEFFSPKKPGEAAWCFEDRWIPRIVTYHGSTTPFSTIYPQMARALLRLRQVRPLPWPIWCTSEIPAVCLP
jgi:hypothetical protein